ncbi:hypothetical protein FGADI_6637 [Fusarium gaditjirri]|uniref:Uncharacterized protein n=1 Tax=Fusarium gaditjirri TaxID=282569 RepID=A0A8H4T785_9HYPO|nr:hypothetical protein FGADI_6637 [Fusarium gaditjirri]
MSSWFSYWRPALEGDRQEERPSTSPWLVPSRILKFNNNNWVTVPEDILKGHPAFLACWRGQATLDFPDLPYHVAHVLLEYIYKREYQNLKVHGTHQARCAIDFSTAVYAYTIGIKYQLPELGQLAAERFQIYGDEITIVEIVKLFSNPPFANMEIKGQLYDYLCTRITRDGATMTTNSRAEIGEAMGNTFISVLYQRIVGLEREKEELQETANSLW